MRASLAFLLTLVAATGFAADRANADTLGAIRSRGAIVIGYREGAPPFSFLDAQKQPQGYSIDICKKIAEAVKAELGMKELPIRYVPVTAENRIEKVESGEIDIECGTTTRTISRQAHVDFTMFTFLTGTEMIVKKDSGIHGPEELANKKIALQPGTTTETAIKRMMSTAAPTAQIVPVGDSAEGLAAVESGKADAYASDEVVLIGLLRSTKTAQAYRLTGQLYSYEPYALMVHRNDGDFRLIADRTLALIYQNGDIDGIWKRWFGDWVVEPPVLLRIMYAMEGLAP
ncbi:MAG TPA: amino acid ABC transporter substrate-binding protein [Stellaceae bacterium]|nr:amino acid ABC transporter substrate-binding protein [Stellaceae bacterium]